MSFKFTRTWFFIVVVVCIAMLIFPPWIATQHFPVGTSELFQGYFLIFQAPAEYELNLHSIGRPYILAVDVFRLGLQIGAWVLLCLLFATRKAK
ncbi:hypothetical protein LLQ54_10130 [Rouxiella badensis]|nr:hypothetical protein [Rouxiella badensis]